MSPAHLLLFSLLAMGMARPGVAASPPSHMAPFRHLAILEQGRVKPMDTFARNLLKQLSGRSSLAGMDAAGWLARVFFSPWETHDDRIFLVDDPAVLSAIGLPAQGRGRYSFRQLQPCLDKLRELAYQVSSRKGGNPGRVASEVMRLFYGVSAYYQMARAFHFVWSGTPDSNATRGGGPAAPAILPLAADDGEEWLSPAEAQIRAGHLPAAVSQELSLLTGAARAFAERRWSAFAQGLAGYNRSLRGRLPRHALSAGKFDLEVSFNRLEPFFKSQLAYVLALLSLFFSWAVWRRWLRRLSLLLLLLGMTAHSAGVIVRILIMARPPVTNLYETFVFVGWAGAVMGLALEYFQRRGLGILCGGLAGLVFLVIAGRFSMEGDTMGMLTAVLDSNWWLSVHVVTIAIGYAGCVVAGICGHWALVQALLPRADQAAGARTDKLLVAALSAGLAFTCIGTVMGGIWADQSWGRFWGWDPKENGALLIILWCAILLHSRRAGWIGRAGLAAGAIGAIVAVAFTWFGVNLMGMGLHAYGFTTGVGRGLAVFVACELAFAALAMARIRGRKG